MATLAANTPRSFELGDRNEIPMIASDIIYEGAAVGVVTASGHARPLAAGDRFVGFAETIADNSSGAAAAKNVRVIRRGAVQLSVTGAVITDVGQPVYATDDNAFGFVGTSGVFIGFVRRFVSAGVAVVEFDAEAYKDPYGGGVYETITGDKTLDVQDIGKTFFVTADAVVTLPAVATGVDTTLICAGAYGTVQISADPNVNDRIHGPDIDSSTGDDKDIVNTKATAQRGDLITLGIEGADGFVIRRLVGTWAREA